MSAPPTRNGQLLALHPLGIARSRHPLERSDALCSLKGDASGISHTAEESAPSVRVGVRVRGRVRVRVRPAAGSRTAALLHLHEEPSVLPGDMGLAAEREAGGERRIGLRHEVVSSWQ